MVKKKYIGAIIFTLTILIASSFIAHSYSDSWIDGTPYLSEEGKMLARVLGTNNKALPAPPIEVKIVPPAYEIGDKRDFLATNLKNIEQYNVEATLLAVSDTAYVFADNDIPIDINKVNSLLKSFDGIYENIIGRFGNIPDGIDGDPRIYFLVLDIADGLGKDDSMIAGYFSPVNQFTNAELKRWNFALRSNEAEMLYIDYLTLKAPDNKAESVAAHEFTHLVQWFLDPLEDVWVDEGTAVYMQSALGYDVDYFITAFEKDSDVSLINWSSTLANYGASYLFFSYISERFGGENAVETILRSVNHGTEGVEKALSELGQPISFDRLFADWIIANYLDDPNIYGGIFGYKNLDVHPKATYIESEYPVIQRRSSVKPWSAQYIEFRKLQEATLNLNINGSNVVAQLIEIKGDDTVVSLVKSSNNESGVGTIADMASKGMLVISSQPDPPESRQFASSYNYSAEKAGDTAVILPTGNNKVTTWGNTKSTR